jgi:YVTN family beta-propeller protein
VANVGSNDLSVIDTARQAVVSTIPVEFQPSGLAVDSIGSQGFVPHLASPRLLVLSLSALKVVRAVTVGPAAAALPEQEGAVTRVYVARPRDRRVSLFDVTLNAEVDSIPVDDEPWRLALDPNREKVYVVNRGSGTVTVIDRFSRRVRATIEVGKRPYTIAIVP